MTLAVVSTHSPERSDNAPTAGDMWHVVCDGDVESEGAGRRPEIIFRVVKSPITLITSICLFGYFAYWYGREHNWGWFVFFGCLAVAAGANFVAARRGWITARHFKGR